MFFKFYLNKLNNGKNKLKDNWKIGKFIKIFIIYLLKVILIIYKKELEIFLEKYIVNRFI